MKHSSAIAALKSERSGLYRLTSLFIGYHSVSKQHHKNAAWSAYLLITTVVIVHTLHLTAVWYRLACTLNSIFVITVCGVILLYRIILVGYLLSSQH